MNVIGVALDPRSLHLSWSPPALDQQNGNIITYGVRIMDLQDGSVRKMETPDLRTTLTVSDLHPYYYYNFTVTAVTLVGEGPYTSPKSIQMPQDGMFRVYSPTIIIVHNFDIHCYFPHFSTCLVPSTSPLHLKITNLAPRTVFLTWDPPPLEDHNGIITGYTVEVFDVENSQTNEVETTETSITRSGLQHGQKYTFTVAAKTVIGRGPFSDSASIITPSVNDSSKCT